jgi:CCR4-NOT transcriptional regulation complex NOT5 subunit
MVTKKRDRIHRIASSNPVIYNISLLMENRKLVAQDYLNFQLIENGEAIDAAQHTP